MSVGEAFVTQWIHAGNLYYYFMHQTPGTTPLEHDSRDREPKLNLQVGGRRSKRSLPASNGLTVGSEAISGGEPERYCSQNQCILVASTIGEFLFSQ
jgi:hypothetical protein